MSMGELLLTLLVVLLVFGPKKLPLLASDLGKFLAKYQRLKEQGFQLWEAHQKLAANQDKAQTADKLYASADKRNIL